MCNIADTNGKHTRPGRPHNTYLHEAVLTKGNRELATSRNRIGTRSRGCGYSDMSLHAERAVVKRLGDLSLLRGCVLVVRRFNNKNEVMNSEPCPDCRIFLTKCMKKWGLLKVMYSS